MASMSPIEYRKLMAICEAMQDLASAGARAGNLANVIRHLITPEEGSVEFIDLTFAQVMARYSAEFAAGRAAATAAVTAQAAAEASATGPGL